MRAKNSVLKPIVGKYALDSISIGMYTNPLMLFREYIQNSVDSIDQAYGQIITSRRSARIDIKIDGRNRTVTIYDNGGGIEIGKAQTLLHDIGNSSKRLNIERGFRGIGRLGGVGYSRELVFKTKARDERKCSISSWDCEKLRNLINNDNGCKAASEILRKIITFKCDLDGDLDEHYFEVKLIDVNSACDVLMDVPRIKKYISQVVPVPFNRNKFKYASQINKYLRGNAPNYGQYKIFVNGEQIFKPYTDYVPLSSSSFDEIKDIRFFKLRDSREKVLAYGWYGTLELFGAITSGSGVDGIRVRKGNILIGSKHLLSPFFKEKRFANYLVGEIHVIADKLIPNARRDDFEDNQTREEFYNAFIREIGMPFSKAIRDSSKKRSEITFDKASQKILNKADEINRKGFVSKLQKKRVINRLASISKDYRSAKIREKIKTVITEASKAVHIVDGKKLSKLDKRRLKRIGNIIYNKLQNKSLAEEIVREIIRKYR